MSATLAIPSTPAHWSRALLDQQVAMLGRLAQVGMNLALAIERQAGVAGLADSADLGAMSDAPDQEGTGADAPEEALAAHAAPDLPSPDLPSLERLYIAYARVARAVRMSLLMQERVIKSIVTLEGGPSREALAQRTKDRIERIVERVADDGERERREVELMLDQTAERLEYDDVYGDVLARPVSEVVAMICEDLGLDPDWPRLARESWAQDEMAGGEVGWPLADVMAAPDWAGGDPAFIAPRGLSRPPLPPAPGLLRPG